VSLRRAVGPARRGDLGFTLLEVVVTLAVLAVALALAGRLVLESQLALVRNQAELMNPLPRYALTRLRADVESALDVPAVLPGWRSSPLVALMPGGGRIAWQRSGDDLERVAIGGAADGEDDVRHIALREVADWRWRVVAPGLVDAEVAFRVKDTAQVPLVGVVRSWSPPTVERRIWIRIVQRAGGAP
jgi:prepilin-type N-terminal cleavage/methylation domain-containing protein